MSALLLLSFLLAPTADAQDRSGQLSLGVSVGDPTALNGKWRPSQAHGFELAAGWGLGHGSLYSHLVYLVHPSVLAREPGFDLGWHVGIGGILRDGPGWADNDLALGARAPIGLDLEFSKIPLEVFGDLALETYVVPGTAVDLGAAVGLRYVF